MTSRSLWEMVFRSFYLSPFGNSSLWKRCGSGASLMMMMIRLELGMTKDSRVVAFTTSSGVPDPGSSPRRGFFSYTPIPCIAKRPKRGLLICTYARTCQCRVVNAQSIMRTSLYCFCSATRCSHSRIGASFFCLFFSILSDEMRDVR